MAEKVARADYLTAMMRAVETIESRLADPVELEELSRAAGLSRFHFSRIFHAMIGEPPLEYVRKRRLTEIARRLIDTDQRILDLAVKFGYESQQSMTKAFHRHYSVAPGQYRREGKRRYFFDRASIRYDELAQLHRNVVVQTRPLPLPALRIVGYPVRLSIYDDRALQEHRQLFREYGSSLKPHRMYRGVFECSLLDREGRRGYGPKDEVDGLIGYCVPSNTAVPDGFREYPFPASRYLTFRYHGPYSVDHLRWLYNYIFSSGMATRTERLADRGYFQYLRNPDGALLIMFPLEADGCEG